MRGRLIPAYQWVYLVKHIIQKTMIPIDMIPLYMMVAASLAMLLFLALCKNMIPRSRGLLCWGTTQ